ncbi:MAG: TRAFs-binding domain-containing protein [Opitutaceae bacterium]
MEAATMGQQGADGLVPGQEPREYERVVRAAVSAGQLLTAIEVAREGLARFGETGGLRQQLALALVQTGALAAAREVLAAGRPGEIHDEETLCLLGRVHKEMWRRAGEPREADAAIQRACELYGEAFARHESYYPGINLAFTLAAAGRRTQARQCARKVARQCEAAARREGRPDNWLARLTGARPPADAGPRDGWLLATLAEALVHLGEEDEAARHYRAAAGLFQGRWRDLASMRRQAREILRFAGRPADALDGCFEFPSVAVFSGHMIDGPGRPRPRFTAAMEPGVRRRLLAQLRSWRVGFGYASGASGGDILFGECLLELGARLQLVLPLPVQSFKRQSVLPAGGDWERRFDALLARAEDTVIVHGGIGGTGADAGAGPCELVYANRVMTGLAALQARALDLELRPLALWDGEPARARGGTASAVEDWRARGFAPAVIAPANESRSAAPKAPAAPALGGDGGQEIEAVVALEVVHFRRVPERQWADYHRVVRQGLAALVGRLPAAPLAVEGLGPVVAFRFASLAAAAELALAAGEWAAGKPWVEAGLPADLGLRVAVHAGPVLSLADPLLGRSAALGAHVQRPQHFLPSVPAGEAYASREFAALCGAERLPGVACEFLGRRPTTQMFEEAVLFRLSRDR